VYSFDLLCFDYVFVFWYHIFKNVVFSHAQNYFPLVLVIEMDENNGLSLVELNPPNPWDSDPRSPEELAFGEVQVRKHQRYNTLNNKMKLRCHSYIYLHIFTTIYMCVCIYIHIYICMYIHIYNLKIIYNKIQHVYTYIYTYVYIK
jgi:hypothetical protein